MVPIINLDPLIIILTITSWLFQVLLYITAWLLRSCCPCCLVSNPDEQIEKKYCEYAIMIPCLNEERVIVSTLEQLSKQTYDNKKIWVFVIDDGSDDKTKEVAEEWINTNQNNKIHFEVFSIPQFIEKNGKQVKFARQGKSIALNRCLKHISQYEEIPKNDLIIGIVDGDGKLDTDIIEEANRKFWIPNVGAVNSSIRIRNRHSLWNNMITFFGNCMCTVKKGTKKISIWTMCQDIEFLVIARFTNFIRGRFLENAFMGGNGQFMRYEVLEQLEDEDGFVWSSDALTEDMDIGIRTWMKGWKSQQIFSSFVRQQGLNDIQSLWGQRKRWAWGTVQVFVKYCLPSIECYMLPRILWKTKYASIISKLDTMFILSNSFFWIILMPLTFIFTLLYVFGTIGFTFSISPLLLWLNGTIWLLFVLIGLLFTNEYRWKAIPSLFFYFIYVFIFAFAFIPAYWNIITCKEAKWAKTAREAEDDISKIIPTKQPSILSHSTKSPPRSTQIMPLPQKKHLIIINDETRVIITEQSNSTSPTKN